MHICMHTPISPVVCYVKCACGVFSELHHLGHQALSPLRPLELIFTHLFILFENAALALPEEHVVKGIDVIMWENRI